MFRKLFVLFSFVLLLVSGSTVQAGPLAVKNHSFELDNAGNQITGHITSMNDVLGWTNIYDYVGVDVACEYSLSELCFGGEVHDGIAVCYGQNEGTILYQILSHNIVGGEEYALIFDATGWKGSSCVIASFFYIDDNNHIELASETYSVHYKSKETQWYHDLTLTFTAEEVQPYVGKRLGIKFTFPTTVPNVVDWSFIDNVRLERSADTSAFNGYPRDGEPNATLDITLSWSPGTLASSHDIYFGTDFDSVKNANSSSTEYRGNQEPNTYDAGASEQLFRGVTYYWRVDEVGESHPDSPWKGDTWSFRIPKTVYVDSDATGVNDGTNWANACNYLQDALVAVSAGDEIWVAEGTYRPDEGAGVLTGDRFVSFNLLGGVAIKGGYAGFGEPEPDDRNIRDYETVLSGEIGDPYYIGDNSYHVVTAFEAGASAILEGFTITSGYASGYEYSWHDSGGGMYIDYDSTPTIVKCTFKNNKAILGGGIYSWGGRYMIVNCILIDNQATAKGGGIFNHSYAGKILTNCVFHNNVSGDWGGAIYNYTADLKMSNCTISHNESTYEVGGIYNYDCSSTLTNCILWGNFGPNDSLQIYPLFPLKTSFCCIQEDALRGKGNTSQDPLLAPDGYHLTSESPCINFGDPEYIAEPDETDIDGDPRIIDGRVDIGADEFAD